MACGMYLHFISSSGRGPQGERCLGEFPGYRRRLMPNAKIQSAGLGQCLATLRRGHVPSCQDHVAQLCSQHFAHQVATTVLAHDRDSDVCASCIKVSFQAPVFVCCSLEHTSQNAPLCLGNDRMCHFALTSERKV